MKFSREKVAAICGFSGIVNGMDDTQFEEYSNALYDFTDSFSVQETQLRNSFAARDYDTFSITMSAVRDVLEKIQAIGLVQSCRRLLDELSLAKYDLVDAHLTYLMAEITALSIDIQMSQLSPDIFKPDTQNRRYGEPREKCILAVDDVSFLLATLKSILQPAGYKITGVTSGDAALRFVEKHTPDLFILDIDMPEMNGYELTEKLRKRGQTAPIIFLTGNATRQYVQKAIELGAVNFIVKPVNKEQVLERIKLHIG